MEIKENKPVSNTDKSKVVKIMDADGNFVDYDIRKYKDFNADYQKALDAAINDGTSGLSDDEIKEYQTAVALAKTDSGKALKEFLRTHTYRKGVVDRMTGKGANDPEFE